MVGFKNAMKCSFSRVISLHIHMYSDYLLRELSVIIESWLKITFEKNELQPHFKT